jgi:hypothetical protein
MGFNSFGKLMGVGGKERLEKQQHEFALKQQAQKQQYELQMQQAQQNPELQKRVSQLETQIQYLSAFHVKPQDLLILHSSIKGNIAKLQKNTQTMKKSSERYPEPVPIQQQQYPQAQKQPGLVQQMFGYST